MKKSLTKNYIYNLIYQILILILPLVTAPYISRVLGAENIGIYSYTISITAYFISFGSLGIALYGQREIAYNQRDKKNYSLIFWEINILRAITIAISLIIYYFAFINGNQYQMYYKILVLEILGTCIDISWFFQGLEEFKKTVVRNMLVKIISVLCIFMFIKSPEDLQKYFVIYVLSVVVGNGTLWLYIPQFLKKVKIKEIRILRHLKPTIHLLIPQLAIQVYTLLDKTMIGTIITDKSEVGFYDQSQKIIKMLLAVVTSLGTVMLPRIASTFVAGDQKKVSEYMKKSFHMVFLLAFPMIFGIIAVSDEFVPVFFGKGYDKVADIMKIISPILLFIGLSNVTGTQYLLPTKRQKEFTISVVCGAVVNFVLNMCLIWKYGAIGASIGTILAELTVTCVQFWFVKNNFKLYRLFGIAKKYFISSVVMLAGCLAVGHFIANNKISIIVQVVVGSILYVVSLLVLRERFVLEWITKITGKFMKNKV